MNWWKRFNRSSAHTQANIVCTFIVMLATIAYAFVAIRQLQEIKRTNDLTQKALNGSGDALTKTLNKMQVQADAMNRLADKAGIQADELDASVKQASRLAKATEQANSHSIDFDRPWLGIIIEPQNFPNGKQPSFLMRIDNSGRRPAKVTSLSLQTAALVSFPVDPPFAAPSSSLSTILLVPNSHSETTVNVPPEMVNEKQLSAYESGVVIFYTYARVDYEDVVTHAKHWIHACTQYEPATVATKAGFYSCTTYNDVDQEN